MNKHIKTTLLSMASVLLVSPVNAQEAEVKRYITASEHPQNVYFGDAHVHTVVSMDAAAWGVQLNPRVPTAMPAAKKSPPPRVGK